MGVANNAYYYYYYYGIKFLEATTPRMYMHCILYYQEYPLDTTEVIKGINELLLYSCYATNILGNCH